MEIQKKPATDADAIPATPGHSPGRRQFLGAAAAALLAGVLIQITGCSSTDDGSDAPPAGSKSAVITDNHPTPHKAVITKAQLDAGGALTLDIQGAADHNHTVSLTADQVVSIKAGNHNMVATSTTNSHNHMAMFN
jgi:hypothetical protein